MQFKGWYNSKKSLEVLSASFKAICLNKETMWDMVPKGVTINLLSQLILKVLLRSSK